VSVTASQIWGRMPTPRCDLCEHAVTSVEWRDDMDEGGFIQRIRCHDETQTRTISARAVTRASTHDGSNAALITFACAPFAENDPDTAAVAHDALMELAPVRGYEVKWRVRASVGGTVVVRMGQTASFLPYAPRWVLQLTEKATWGEAVTRMFEQLDRVRVDVAASARGPY
jgi:hypothetical protein